MTILEKNECCCEFYHLDRKDQCMCKVHNCHSLNTKTAYETISENIEKIGMETLVQADKGLLEFYAGDTKTGDWENCKE